MGGMMPEKIEPDFETGLEKEIPRLKRYARALTRDVGKADDLVQSCLTRAIAKQHLWERDTDLRAWLLTILHNMHVDEVRRSVREGAHDSITAVSEALTSPARAYGLLDLRDLQRTINLLPQEQREIVLLIGLEGMEYKEVAEILRAPVGTVRSRLSRGRDQLRRLMGMEVPHRSNGRRSSPQEKQKRPRERRTGGRIN